MTLQETEIDLPVMSKSLQRRLGSTEACHRVLGTEYNSPWGLGTCWYKSFSRRPPLPPFGQKANYREGTQPCLLKGNWIKDLLSMAHPSEQDPDSPTASPYHQETSTSLLQYAEGRQNENHNYRKLSKLITWITACL